MLVYQLNLQVADEADPATVVPHLSEMRWVKDVTPVFPEDPDPELARSFVIGLKVENGFDAAIVMGILKQVPGVAHVEPAPMRTITLPGRGVVQ